jgi:hypothetical protein
MKLQFRLRTLMIGVTVFCVVSGYVAHEAKIASDRAAMLKFHIISKAVKDFYPAGWNYQTKSTGIPMLRLLIGDHEFTEIQFFESTPEEVLDKYRAMFPEAKMRRVAN